MQGLDCAPLPKSLAVFIDGDNLSQDPTTREAVLDLLLLLDFMVYFYRDFRGQRIRGQVDVHYFNSWRSQMPTRTARRHLGKAGYRFVPHFFTVTNGHGYHDDEIIELMKRSNHEIIMLVGSDNDFWPVALELRARGARVANLAIRSSLARDPNWATKVFDDAFMLDTIASVLPSLLQPGRQFKVIAGSRQPQPLRLRVPSWASASTDPELNLREAESEPERLLIPA